MLCLSAPVGLKTLNKVNSMLPGELAASAHTQWVQVSVYSVDACWRSGLGQGMPSRYLA